MSGPCEIGGAMHVFWSCRLEHLGEHEVGEAVDAVIGVFCQIVFGVASLGLLVRLIWFDPV